MNAASFWEVISRYNKQTWPVQVIFFVGIILSLIISKNSKYKNLVKITLGLSNLFISFVFFFHYGTEPIQKFFAFPLYLIIGLLFLYESIKNYDDTLQKAAVPQLLLILLFLLYPFLSHLLGNRFPGTVTYIMPCPLITLSIALYSMYKTRNRALLLCLALWGLTGIKSLFFNAYEDLILLAAGLYCIYILLKNRSRKLESL